TLPYPYELTEQLSERPPRPRFHYHRGQPHYEDAWNKEPNSEILDSFLANALALGEKACKPDGEHAGQKQQQPETVNRQAFGEIGTQPESTAPCGKEEHAQDNDCRVMTGSRGRWFVFPPSPDQQRSK